MQPSGWYPATHDWWRAEFQRLDAMAQPDDYQWQLSLGPVSTFAARFYTGNTFWNDMIEHPDYDDFWQARAPEPKLRGVTAAVPVVGGWFDDEDLYGPFSVYRTLRAYNRKANTSLVMGPFGHRGWAAPDDGRCLPACLCSMPDFGNGSRSPIGPTPLRSRNDTFFMPMQHCPRMHRRRPTNFGSMSAIHCTPCPPGAATQRLRISPST